MALSVEGNRIERLIQSLAAASVDLVDASADQIEVFADDDFGHLEAAFKIFITELAEAKRSLEGAVAEAQAARADAELRLETIEQQRLTIRELSTPVLEVWDNVVTMPVVGSIDTQRAVDMSESLLEFIVKHGTHTAILDLTGVEVVDTSTADHLGRLIRSARLLGTRCIVTGIRPKVATTLMELGVQFGEVQSMRTLREGLRSCISDSSTAD